MYYIIEFCADSDDYGLYVRGYTNHYGTPLYFRGTFAEVMRARITV